MKTIASSIIAKLVRIKEREEGERRGRGEERGGGEGRKEDEEVHGGEKKRRKKTQGKETCHNSKDIGEFDAV